MNKQPSFQANRTFLKNVLPLDTPYMVQIDISELCNVKCSYCFRSWGYEEYGFAIKKNHKHLMSMDLFNNAVEQIKDFPQKVRKISLSGQGEPLCNRNLCQMIRHVKNELQTTVEIHTNGLLITPDLAEELAESDIDKIVVSIQGLNSDIYKEICGTSVDMEKFIYNLRILYQKSKNTTIFIKIVDVALKPEEHEVFYKMFESVGHSVFVERTLDVWNHLEEDYKQEAFTHNKFNREIPYQDCCSLSFYTLLIDPEGLVYPCFQPLAPSFLGNIQDKNIVDMWNSEERFNFLMKQLKTGRKSFEVCQNCVIAQNTIMSQEHDSLNGAQKGILAIMKKGR